MITFTPEFPQYWPFLKKKRKNQYLTFIENLASYNFCKNVAYRAASLVGHGWLYCTMLGLSETVIQRFSIKQLLLKSLQYPQKTPVLEFFLKTLRVWRPANLLKRDPKTGVFLWILQNFYYYLFRKLSANDYFLTFSMVHYYIRLKVQGLHCMTASRFRIWDTGLVFCF